MYSETFEDLVRIAYEKSESILNTPNIKTNPYYIGFGNPNAKILIIGQEKAIKSDNVFQIKAESFDNPKQWNYLIKNKINNTDYNFYPDFYFKNPLHPYDGKPTKGNTWLQYQKLMNLIYPNFINHKTNNFLLNSFITEINHQVSPKQLGNQKDEERESINNHNFYKSFNVTILAIGTYLNISEIENRFDVKFKKDYSLPRKKMLFFINDSDNRIVINIRQLSNDIGTEYLERIAEVVKGCIENHLLFTS